MGVEMARPREFDQDAVLDTAMRSFWRRGYEATSVRDLMSETGLTGASLYNAFGDKRSLYEMALDHYVDASVLERIERFRRLAPREAIRAFFAEIIERSLTDIDRKGCMLVNAALEVAPHDPGFRGQVAAALQHVETFFHNALKAGQVDGTVTQSISADELARHLLGVLLGVRVLARIRPERLLLEGVVSPALALLEPPLARVG